jgi:hypothetical protein
MRKNRSPMQSPTSDAILSDLRWIVRSTATRRREIVTVTPEVAQSAARYRSARCALLHRRARSALLWSYTPGIRPFPRGIEPRTGNTHGEEVRRCEKFLSVS